MPVIKRIVYIVSVLTLPCFSFATDKIELQSLILKNKVAQCFELKMTQIESDKNIGSHILKLDVKRLKDRGSDWQEQIDCCPKYTFPYLTVKDKRGKNFSKSLIKRPDEKGELSETEVSLTNASRDLGLQLPLTISTVCE